jgi:streptogramin lyase
VTVFSKRDDERRSGRADSRKSKQNRLFWMGASELRGLEPRTMLALTVTTFPISLVAIVQPQGIATGSDGNLWFTENGAGKIGRMTPSGAVTSFALPQIPPPAGSPAGTAATTPHPTDITAGPDGALGFTGIPGEIGRITTTGTVTDLALPALPPPPGSKPGTARTLATATAIVAGPDGALWFTGVPGEIGRMSTAGVVTEFAVPLIPPPAGSQPGTAGTPATLTAITPGPDRALWFTGVPGKVGRITTAGVVTEFAVPAIPPPASSAAGSAVAPVTINTTALDSITPGQGQTLWFTGMQGELGRFTTAGVVTEYAIPSLGTGSTIMTGPGGSLWFTEPNGLGVYNGIGRLAPGGAVASFSLPGNFSSIAGLALGPGGNLWFTEQEDGHTDGQQPAIGEITAAGVTTLHAIPQGTTLDPSLGVPVNPTAITTGPDGALWFGEFGAIGRITTSGSYQQFPLPPAAGASGNITAGPDGDIWFTDNAGIGRITTKGTITTYPLPILTSAAYLTPVPDGNIWFVETRSHPTTSNTSAIALMTPAGQIETFALPGKFAKNASLGDITLDPDGKLWFPVGVGTTAAIGRITATGKIKLYGIPSTGSEGSYHAIFPNPPTDIISGPGGKLWYTSTVDGKAGIARISTKGKHGPFIPIEGPISGVPSNLVALPNGQVWFENQNNGDALGIATRSGILATQDLPTATPAASATPLGNPYGSLTVGPDGNIWGTSRGSGIVRISRLDSLAGSLDYRKRPERGPDLANYGYDMFSWTNVTTEARPSFAGVGRPGADVTLWAQKQGENPPVLLGQATASSTDGSWTLKSQVKLSNGNYAVTATQTGDSGPPSVLYSLTPDSYGNLPNALVIQAAGARNT